MSLCYLYKRLHPLKVSANTIFCTMAKHMSFTLYCIPRLKLVVLQAIQHLSIMDKTQITLHWPDLDSTPSLSGQSSDLDSLSEASFDSGLPNLRRSLDDQMMGLPGSASQYILQERNSLYREYTDSSEVSSAYNRLSNLVDDIDPNLGIRSYIEPTVFDSFID